MSTGFNLAARTSAGFGGGGGGGGFQGSRFGGYSTTQRPGGAFQQQQQGGSPYAPNKGFGTQGGGQYGATSNFKTAAGGQFQSKGTGAWGGGGNSSPFNKVGAGGNSSPLNKGPGTGSNAFNKGGSSPFNKSGMGGSSFNKGGSPFGKGNSPFNKGGGSAFGQGYSAQQSQPQFVAQQRSQPTQKFEDKRNDVIKQLNQLQMAYGTGKFIKSFSRDGEKGHWNILPLSFKRRDPYFSKEIDGILCNGNFRTVAFDKMRSREELRCLVTARICGTDWSTVIRDNFQPLKDDIRKRLDSKVLVGNSAEVEFYGEPRFEDGMPPDAPTGEKKAAFSSASAAPTRHLFVEFAVKEKGTGAKYSAVQVVDVVERIASTYQHGVIELFHDPASPIKYEIDMISPVPIEKDREIAIDPPRPIAFGEREWTKHVKDAREMGRQHDRLAEDMYKSVNIKQSVHQDQTVLFPRAMYGFDGLLDRLDKQSKEERRQEEMIKKIDIEYGYLDAKQEEIRQKMEEATCKFEENSAVLMELMHDIALSTPADADAGQHYELRQQLGAIQQELTNPTRCIGQLHDLVAQVEMADEDPYKEVYPEAVPESISELAQHLKVQQQGLDHMIHVIKADLKNLDKVEAKMREQLELRRSYNPW